MITLSAKTKERIRAMREHPAESDAFLFADGSKHHLSIPVLDGHGRHTIIRFSFPGSTPLERCKHARNTIIEALEQNLIPTMAVARKLQSKILDHVHLLNHQKPAARRH